MSNSMPDKIGKYEVRNEINRGSMGVVYLGNDPYINRHVALKLAFLDSLNDPEFGERYRKMFFNEAHTAGLLSNPNIINIYDAGVDGDNCYIVMEYIEGGNTLKPYCNTNMLLPINKVVEIIFKCASALDYAHRQGVVHRDIKPSNILFTPDQDVKIADFGIAYIYNADSTATQMGTMMGSPRYMSPEQLKEEYITNQSDIFSLGVVMYELLTGRQPFAANSFSRLVNSVLNDKPPPMSNYRSDLPEALNEIMIKALSKDLSNRYKMGLDFAADLSKAFHMLKKPKEDVFVKERFNSIKNLEFFVDFDDTEIWEILRSCTWKAYHVNDDIIVEGDIDDCFYVIVNGSVEVMKNRSVIRRLRKGDCFGEMGYLSKTKRTATIKSLDCTSIMKINSTVINQASINCQVRFYKVFLKTLINRLSETTEKISQEV
jgi:eukaryotic-like serine/threonine-protein kinase